MSSTLRRQCLCIGLLTLGGALAAEALGAETLEADQEAAYVYETPNPESGVLRRLYLGEQIEVVGVVVGTDGRRYAEVRLGTQKGYVLESKLVTAASLDPKRFKKRSIVRDERPIGIGVRGMGELFGVGLDLRYLPLTRLGVGIHIGPMLDEWHAKGTAWSLGLIGFAAKTPFSPFVEAGVVSIGYHGPSTVLKIVALYLCMGIEWQSRWGGYIQAGATFVRSMMITVTARYSAATTSSFTAEPYGVLDGYITGTDLFQTIRPTFTLGYAF